MKRSEMIAILEDVFRNYDNGPNIAERALSAMEEAGMRPPHSHLAGWGYDGPVIWNYWEPEDATV